MGFRVANVRETVRVALRMKLLFPLVGHLLVTLARLARAGGIHSVVAESLALKHQLPIMAMAATRPQSDCVGPAVARILDAFGVAEALA